MKKQKSDLPDMKTVCRKSCVYSHHGICDSPRVNKGNSDAACYSMSIKDLLEYMRHQGIAKRTI